MKMICISPGDFALTEGKEYEGTIREGGTSFDVLANDGGVPMNYYAYRFKKVIEPIKVAGSKDDSGKLDMTLFDDMPRALEPIKVAGRKDDSGKLDMTLFDDMPRALEAVAEVMQWAITKKEPAPYERGSWLGVHPNRYRAAIKRHDSSAAKQADKADANAPRFQRDDETKLLHLAHIACSALFALELTIREMEANDNAK
jgi:hypothetical protein